jgi:hypothetical protein
MGYGNGMAGSKSMIRKPAVRKKIYSKEFSTFYTNFESVPNSARIQWTGSGGVVPGRFKAKKGYPICFFTAADNSVVDKKFSLRTITADSVSKGSHLVTFNQS